MTPAQYVAWAQRRSKELDLSFDGTPERINTMIRENQFASGDIFLDYDVKGSLLSRNGLDALVREAINDPRVAAVMIPRRDRLARPDDPLDGIRLENVLRSAGKSIVYMERTLPPLKKGGRFDIAELILGVIDFDHAGTFRRDLAQKILYAQLRLAKLGFSTGGRPPYGFRRWLIKDNGEHVRELAEGEWVKMAGHHVVWLPTAEAELKVIYRILEMLEAMPASRVAARLTVEGVPSPDHGRWRKDRGTKHPVSGVWHQTTIVNIARNKLLVAVASFGLRSMGDKLRFAPEGPRELEKADFREDEKPKVVRNPESQRITAPARFEPLVDVERHQKLLATLDARGGTQRGKPRSHDPTKNPLGGRIFDMNCSWLMYRTPYCKTFRYGCGSYLQSHGASCAHNTVDGPTASKFMLSCLRQRLLPPTLLPKVEQRFRDLAAQGEGSNDAERELTNLRAELAQTQTQLTTVSVNMALAKTPEQFEAISATFDQLKARVNLLQTQIVEAESKTKQVPDTEAEIAGAMDVIHRLTELVADASGLGHATEAFRLTNARLFMRFRPVQGEKRVLNKVAGGVVVLGAAPDPIEIYRGPTGRRALNYNGSTALVAAEPGKLSLLAPPETTIGSGLEGKSLRNVSRGDWI